MTREKQEIFNVGVEEIEATVMFTDLKRFSSIAEILTATDTAALLNSYFLESTPLFVKTQVTLLKYIGDSVLAIWGEAGLSEDHAVLACRTAVSLVRMQETLHESPGGWLHTRIGVHTGPMIMGNLGSDRGVDYTAIGDTVNLASRLEGLNKIFGTLAIASGETISQARGQFIIRPLGCVRVVGRSESVEIYELLCEKGEKARLSDEALTGFSAALESYAAGRLKEATNGFRETRELCGGEDGPSTFYLQSLASQRRATLRKDWDGVINLSEFRHGS